MALFENTTIQKVKEITGTIAQVNTFSTSSIANLNDYEDTTWEQRLTENFIVNPFGELLIDPQYNTVRAL